MKKILIMLLVLLPLILLGEIDNTTGGRLPRDSNGSAIQLGNSIRLYDADSEALEHMYNGTFVDTTRWDLTDSLSISGGKLVYTETDTLGTASTATMAGDSLLVAVRDTQVLRFYYDVTVDSTVVSDSTITESTIIAWIDGLCDSTALSLVAGTSKSVIVTVGASGSDSSFVFHIDPDTTVTRADFSFDNFKLLGYYESPISILTGASATITVPDNAVSLYIDPATADVKITIGASYFITSTAMTIPVLGHDTITITDVAGGSVVSFYFSML